MGFPGSSAGEESACNAGQRGSIPGSGRSAGGQVTHSSILGLPWWLKLIKNLPAMQIWVQSLGWEDPLEKGPVTHSSFLAWRIP